ncbi:MAG: class I SAM-dependent methyltransferase [Coriobacteriales bacterium]|nr:class I SAM-dependent methyltransferase [Coriobacteriales bacterium]
MAEDRAFRASDYDEFVDWNARLGRELPFFRALFAEYGVRRVLDAGCGSGQHAIAFANEGLDVAGLDPSEGMLAQARHNAREAGVHVRFAEGTFADAGSVAFEEFGGPADAVLTLGNGLPHVAGIDGLREALGAFAEALRTGGVLVLHLLNHERLIRGSIRTVPPKVRETADGTKVFVRVIDYIDEGLVFDFVTIVRQPGAIEGDRVHAGDDAARDWSLEARRSVHTALPIGVLREELGAAGFAVAGEFGSHSRSTLVAETDESVIVVATKR